MIKVVLSNEILKRITAIEENRVHVASVKLPGFEMNRLRKNSKKKSTYASTKIEGNPLSERQVEEVIDSDPHRHLLKPEQEVRNYFMALELLEAKLVKRERLSLEFILEVQALVEKGAPKNKIGLRGPMPPGFLFAVYDSQSGKADYIPPDYSEVPELLEELVEYVNTTDDHPLLVAAIVHYQLVTIHPFEDGNGRTARLLSGYILDYYGYDFKGMGSLEEYFAYDAEEYYSALQMGLPPLYYLGRENPPKPEIWISYFLRMLELYSKKVRDLSEMAAGDSIFAGVSHLKRKEKELLLFLLVHKLYEFTPIELSKLMKVTNKTIINRCVALVQEGFVFPVLVKERIRSYRLSEYCKNNEEAIIENLMR